ncbi:MAG: glycosyltransferase [Anaerolineales bacterium]|nr:MAG: glycosyltransferase [Anaerolineales bacterium]
MSLRIGIDYTAAVRQRAGIGRYTRGLVQALARLDRENQYVLFMAHDSAPYQRYWLSGNEKVLLIGEHTGNVALFEGLLTRKGVTVIVAPLKQALAVLRQQMPHQAWLFSWTADLERTPSGAALVAEARSLAIPLHRIPRADTSLAGLLRSQGSRLERPPSDMDAAPTLPVKAPNFQDRRAPLSERALTILWHRLSLPIPVEWFTGPVDIFHSTDFVLPPVRQARTILTVHDLTFMRLPECAEAGLRAYLNKVVSPSIERADLLLADSQSTKNDLIELLGVSPDKIEVVYAGVERRFRPMKGEMALRRAKKRYRLDSPFILSLGTLEPRKNFTGLIEAYALMGDKELKLVIAGGKGWLYDEIFARVEELGLEDKISFPGFIADEDLPALYNLAELFVFPSLYEGFGLPPLEAMACGTPVVTSDRPSLPEVVGGAGLMVEATDSQELAKAMERVLTDENLRREMREKGLKQAAKFTWEAAAEKLLDVYRMLGSSGGKRK